MPGPAGIDSEKGVRGVTHIDGAGGLTRFSGHSRLVVSSCSNHDVVVELFEVGGADHSEAGVPPLGVIPTFNPLKHGGGKLNPAGPRLPVEQFCLHG